MVELSYKCANWLVINENRKIPCQIGWTFLESIARTHVQ